MLLDETTPLANELEKHIRKLINPLKTEEELKEILKVKMTKKEYKIFEAWAMQIDVTPLLAKLSIDEERYASLKEKLIKKINQEKFKQEIMI